MTTYADLLPVALTIDPNACDRLSAYRRTDDPHTYVLTVSRQSLYVALERWQGDAKQGEVFLQGDNIDWAMQDAPDIACGPLHVEVDGYNDWEDLSDQQIAAHLIDVLEDLED
jgi:hypothetical protein